MHVGCGESEGDEAEEGLGSGHAGPARAGKESEFYLFGEKVLTRRVT